MNTTHNPTPPPHAGEMTPDAKRTNGPKRPDVKRPDTKNLLERMKRREMPRLGAEEAN